MASSKEGDGSGFSTQQIESANAALQRYNALQTERQGILDTVGGKEENLKTRMTASQTELDKYKGRVENLSQEQIDLANKAEKAGTEMADGIKQAADANEKAGHSFVKLSNNVDSSNVSLGKAARALFS
jgi:predicted  nucleic acid-binding Zn-ribbon protein